MPVHAANRTAFVKCDTSEPLLRLYTTLIAVELALKDHAGSFSGGHDLQGLATPLLGPTAGTLQAVLTALDGSLKKLRCTLASNHGACVRPNKYPDLRYLRFAKDGFSDGSPDVDILQALQDAEQLVKELRQAGVSL